MRSHGERPGLRGGRCWAPVLAVFVGGWLAGCGAAPPRPDVVIVTWDTTRADHVGPDAAVAGLTPHWSRMAAAGVRFATARTPSPTTLPAHASLLTGQLPSAHGARANAIFSLPQSAETLAERLAAEGWRTGAFVSAAVLDARFGLAQGFETYDDRVGSVVAESLAERPADATVDAAADWIHSIPADEPIFLWVHLFDPHWPWHPPPQWAAAHPGSPYRAEIAFADDQTGRLLEVLEHAGRLERALLVMTADHGEGLGEHGEHTHGYFLYDSTVRVPLLFWAGERSGSRLAAGLRVDTPVLLSDVAPTLLELLGLEPGADGGRSLVSLLRGEGAAPRELALENVDPSYAYGAAPAFGVVDAEGGVWIDLPRREHYDIERDPQQLRNLYTASLDAEADALFARHARAWPPPEPPSDRELDAGGAAQLAALGYLTGRVGAALPDATGSRPAPDPKDLLPVAALWMGHHEGRRADRALAEADRLVGRFGALPALALFRADRLDELSRPEEAIALLRESAEAHPEAPRVRAELEARLRRRAADRALAQRIRTVLAQQPDHPAAAHDLAVVLHRLGETDEAERLYRRWLERHPEDTAARLDLYRILGARGAFDEALALLREAGPAGSRPAALECAEGRLLAWWMERPEDARRPLRACRDKGALVAPRELELIAGR